MIQVLIHSVYPNKNVYFLKFINKKARSSKLGQKGYQDVVIVLFTSTPSVINTATNPGEKRPSTSSSKRKHFLTKLCSLFGVTYRKIRYVGMK